MKITKKQLIKIIKEALNLADNTKEDYNAMIGFIKNYIASKDIGARQKRSEEFSNLESALLDARDGDLKKLKELDDKNEKRYVAVKKQVDKIKKERSDDYDAFSREGARVKKVSEV